MNSIYKAKQGPIEYRVDTCVTSAIVEHVRVDDMREWGQKPAPEFEVVEGLPSPKPVPRGILHTMVLQWLP